MDEIVNVNFLMKFNPIDRYDIANDSFLVTCYEGLRCHSTLCLDWREICNGIFNCENGEDEPIECLLLETNECEEDEYRCRFGMCIPRTFLRDFSYDCMDRSDETFINPLFIHFDSCYTSPRLECDYQLCHLDEFSCGDGQCMHMDNWLKPCVHHEICPKHCFNGRDRFFNQNLLRWNLAHSDKKFNAITDQCWFLLLCASETSDFKLFGYASNTCPCSNYSERENQCRRYFQNVCPTSFIFQPARNFLYPFVQLLYHNTSNSSSSSEWWLPTHLCYPSTSCPALPFAGLPLVDNLLCIATGDIRYSASTVKGLIKLFSACSNVSPAALASHQQLFYCNRSKKFISKHRIYDMLNDCVYSEDEDWMSNSTTMHIVNMTDRFKCATTNQWVPRQFIGKGICGDMSDTFYIGTCTRSSDFAC